MTEVQFIQFNESHLKIQTTDWGIDSELSEFFSFFVDGYKFMPKFKSGQWSGKINLFDVRSKKLPKGLLKVAVKFCKSRNYTFNIEPELNPRTDITEAEVNTFIKSIPVTSKGKEINIRDYQVEAIQQSMKYYRSMLISPTASGKSLILYNKIRYHIDVLDHNVVLIVPTVALTRQMETDFIDYSTKNGWDVESHTQLLYSGKEKLFNKKLLISTWQSLMAMSKNNKEAYRHIIERTDLLCIDEVHSFSSTATLDIANSFVNTKWRTGTTGTLDDSKVNKLQLIGIMSEPFQVITTKQLMDANSIVKLKINVLKLQYPDEYKKQLSGMNYKDEIKHLVTLDARNQFISELATRCKGVTLVLFTFIELHGNTLYKKIQELNPDRVVKYIHGGVDVDEREQVRVLAETDDNCIIIASASIFSTGTNIPSIENIIFAMPTKSTIRIRQSIGRGLRLRKGKTQCNLFDISDDLTLKSYTNTTFIHMLARIDIYKKEQFEFVMQNIPMSGYLQKVGMKASFEM